LCAEHGEQATPDLIALPTSYRGVTQDLQQLTQQESGCGAFGEECNRSFRQSAGFHLRIVFSAQHKYIEVLAFLPQATKQLQSVHVRHAEINHGRGHVKFVEQGETRARAQGGAYVVPPIL
jgi:hypothetical protein